MSVAIGGGDQAVIVGSTLQLSAEITRVGDVDDTVVWSSHASAIAIVGDTGLVTGVALGETRITARSVVSPSVSDTITVTVIAEGPGPEAILRVSPRSGFVPLTVLLDGTASSSSGGAAPTYEWEVSGQTFIGPASVVRVLDASGRHGITLTVRDDGGRTSSTKAEVRTGPFGGQATVAATIRPADYYNRFWIAHDGDTVLVPIVADGVPTTYGQVGVFDRDERGSWVHTASLVPPSGSMAYSDVGRLVRLSGDVAAVMTIRSTGSGTPVQESAIHVFERVAGSSWLHRATLLRDEGVGTRITYMADVSIALQDGVLVVGLPDGTGFGSEVRVYVQDHGGPDAWGLAQTMPLPAGVVDYQPILFGSDVAVGKGGDVIAVAKSAQNNDGGLGSGEAAFVYERVAPGANTWDLVRTLRWSSDLPSPYSTHVAVDGDTLAVTHVPTVWSDTVEVAVYERDHGGPRAWQRVATQHVTLAIDDGYMPAYAHVAMRLVEHTLAVGFTPGPCGSITEPALPGGCRGGQVTLFGRDVGGASVWGEAHVLVSSVSYEGHEFGAALDLASDGASIIVAARPLDGSVPATIYAFRR